MTSSPDPLGNSRLEHCLLSHFREGQLSLSDTVSEFSGGWIMNTLIAMGLAWGVITLVFVILLLYRRSLTKNESDWIPLTDDAKEDSAIQAQTIIEMKTKKLTDPDSRAGVSFAGHAAGHCGVSGCSIPSLLRPRCRSKAQSRTDLGRSGRNRRCPLRLLPLLPVSLRVSCASFPQNSSRSGLKPGSAAANRQSDANPGDPLVQSCRFTPPGGAGMKTKPPASFPLPTRSDWFQAGIPGFPPRHSRGKSGRE